MPDEFRSVYGVAEGLIGNLDGQISQQPLLGLNGIPFIVIIGEVEQLEAEWGPKPFNDLGVQSADADGTFTQRQHVRSGIVFWQLVFEILGSGDQEPIK